MVSESATEFDLGPLTWVQGEIDEALTRGTEALAAFRANPDDTAALAHARSHVHQAAGAIQMVGLDGVVAFTDEIERQLVRIGELASDALPAIVEVVDHACHRLRVFLDEVAKGAPPVPLALAAEYEAMRRARGIGAPSPTDLFFPDLNVRPPRSAAPEIMPAARLASHLLKERRQYQRGLLDWLRGADGGADTMRAAVAAIEDVTAQSSLRAFWWTAGALLEGLEKKAIEPSFGVKQLVARIDMQIRRVTEGSAKVADRLRREVLYYIAIAAPVAPQIEAVQRAYQLAALIPSAEALDADLVRVRPLLRDARDRLASAKEAWLKAASGRAETLPKVASHLASAFATAQKIGHPALARLTGGLAACLEGMPAQGVGESLAMEFATALLLAESAYENFANLATDFADQVDAMLARLASAQAGTPAAAGGAAPALDEMSRRAQERVLLGQVMREVQVNLRHMEQVLDAFFRDHTRRADLAGLAKDSQQIRGAMRMLDLDEADRLLALCQSQIESYADPTTPVDEDGLELLAESLSGLGFYIEAVLHQRPDRERIIAPLIAKRLGEAPRRDAPEPQSVEDSVAELRAALPRLLADVRAAPADAIARGELRGKLVSLRDDADLIGDAELVGQVKAALREIDGGGQDAAIAASVDLIVESGVTPAPALSEETQRLLATDASALDAELLDIYLTEADDVLDAVDAHRRILEHSPADREALVTVRRQFHTLKGSGRMVGLTELGELAWGVERVHNRLLEEDRRVTPAVLALIGVAATSFRHWVRELRESGRFATDASSLLSAIRDAEAEWVGTTTLTPPSAPVAPATPMPIAAERPIGPVSRSPVAPAASDDDEAPVPSIEDRVLDVAATVGSQPVATATGDSDRRADLPDLELVTFPELGSPLAGGTGPTVTVLEESVGETIDVGLPIDGRDAGKPVLRVVADNTSTLPPEARARASTLHAPDLTLLTDGAGRRIAASQADASDEVSVGDVRIPASLWRILCDEADQHVALLQHELSLLQFDPDHWPIETLVRASHTLCGIHRTGGIALVATTARALEQSLLALAERGAPFPGVAQPVLARAIAALAHFVARVKDREGFTAHDEREAADVVVELDELRQEALASVPPAEPLIPPEEGSDRLELVADLPERNGADELADADVVISEAPGAATPARLDATPAADSADAAMRWSPFAPDPNAVGRLEYVSEIAVPAEGRAASDEPAVVDHDVAPPDSPPGTVAPAAASEGETSTARSRQAAHRPKRSRQAAHRPKRSRRKPRSRRSGTSPRCLHPPASRPRCRVTHRCSTSSTTSTRPSCRSFWRRPPNSFRRPVSCCGAGAAFRTTRPRRPNCGARCIR